MQGAILLQDSKNGWAHKGGSGNSTDRGMDQVLKAFREEVLQCLGHQVHWHNSKWEVPQTRRQASVHGLLREAAHQRGHLQCNQEWL